MRYDHLFHTLKIKPVQLSLISPKNIVRHLIDNVHNALIIVHLFSTHPPWSRELIIVALKDLITINPRSP
jgi:hypothetical protein